MFALWLLKKQNPLSIFKSPILLSILLYLLALTISAIFGLNPSTSFWSVVTRTTGIWYFIHLAILVYLMCLLLSDKVRTQRLILVVIFSTALYSVLAFTSPEGINILFTNYRADAFTFGNSSFAGMYIFGAFLLSLYYLFQSEKKKWWMYAIPLLLIINPNILSGAIWSGDFSHGIIGEARASSLVIILSIVCLFCVWLISRIKNIKARTITIYSVFGVSILGLIFCASSLLSTGGYLRNIYLKEATGARPLVWEMSKNIIAQKPFIGWGSDNFEKVFEVNYDNRILQDEYGNEAWFDRAHNVFIDQLVDNGFVGLILYILVYIVIALCLIRITQKSIHRSDRILAYILLIYFPLHLIELQTGFDTSISYLMVAIMIALAVTLYDRTQAQISKVENEWYFYGWLKYSFAIVIGIFSLWSFVWGWIPFVRAEIANGYIRTVGSASKRIPTYPILFGSPVDQHSFIWRTSTDFQRGIAENPAILDNPSKVSDLRKEMAVFEDAYREYIKKNPSNIRARLNLADILIYERLFEVDKLAEAQSVLDGVIEVVPQMPQPYWMKAVAYIYMKDFTHAREFAQKGLLLNPKIQQSKDVVKYVEESIKNFPNINLFFFRQI
jgi:O-antigen ligase